MNEPLGERLESSRLDKTPPRRRARVEEKTSDAEARASDAASVSELREALAATEAAPSPPKRRRRRNPRPSPRWRRSSNPRATPGRALADARRAAAESAANLARASPTTSPR